MEIRQAVHRTGQYWKEGPKIPYNSGSTVIFKRYEALSLPEDLTHNPYDNPPEIFEQKNVN